MNKRQNYYHQKLQNNPHIDRQDTYQDHLPKKNQNDIQKKHKSHTQYNIKADLSVLQNTSPTTLCQKYQNIIFDQMAQYDCYLIFKELETYIKAFLIITKQNDVSQLEDRQIQILIDQFLKCSSVILKNDLTFSNNKKIEMRYWTLMKLEIELSRKFYQNNYKQLENVLNNRISFLRQQISDLKDQKNLILQSKLDKENFQRRILANVISYQGELVEYRDKCQISILKQNEKRSMFNESAIQYYEAINTYPFDGKIYMLLATCMQLKQDMFGATYWAIRAYCAENPFNIKEKILEIFEQIRHTYESIFKGNNKDQYSQLSKQANFQMFIISFLRYQGLLMTKINTDELQNITLKMYSFMSKYFEQLSKESDIQIQELSSISNVLMMIIFSLYNVIEGYSLHDKSNESTKQRHKQHKAIFNDIHSSNCLKYSFGLLYPILNFLIDYCDQEYQFNMVQPIFYFFYEYTVIFECMIQKYSLFKELIQRYFEKIEGLYQKKLESVQEQLNEEITEKQLLEICVNNYFQNDIQLIGFAPLIPFYKKIKKEKNLYRNNSLSFLAKYFFFKKVVFRLKQSLDKIQSEEESVQIQKEQKNEENYFCQQQQQQQQQQEEVKEIPVQQNLMHLKRRQSSSSEEQQENYDDQEEEDDDDDDDDDDDFLDDLIGQNVKQNLESFKQNTQKETVKEESSIKIDLKQEKNVIIVDGQNCAIRKNQKQFSSQALQIVADFWREKGHRIHFLLPDYYLDEQQIAKKMISASQSDLKKLPDDMPLLLKLRDEGLISGVPNWEYDDSFIIDYARKKNGYIVSNDRYNDYIKNYSKNDMRLRDELRNWIRSHCISFTFIGEDFMPNPDFMKQMFENYDDNDGFQQKHLNKTIKIYRNGNPDKMVVLKLSTPIKFKNIAKEVQEQLPLNNVTILRFFTPEGVEIFEDDLTYIKDGSILYASKGEVFDQNSIFSEYNILEKIGQGGFGSVMLGEHKVTKEKVAIKIVNTGTIGNAQDIDMVFREAEMLKSLNHKHIVKIINCFTLPNMQVVFIMEYLQGGELLQYVVDHGQLEESVAKIFFKQIVEAIYYCHKEKLIHRDLKLENILLTDTKNQLIKIVDFGIAGVNSNINIENQDAGSLMYLAPEIYLKKPNAVTPALDIWAMGVILFGMLVGQLPFNGKDNHETAYKISKADWAFPQHIAKKLSPDVKDLLNKIFTIDANKRLNINEVIEHSWIKKDHHPKQMIDEIDESLKEDEEQEEDQKPLNIKLPLKKDIKPIINKPNSTQNVTKPSVQNKKPVINNKRVDKK